MSDAQAGKKAQSSRTRPLADRLWEKVGVRGPNECWLWQASQNGAGYGQIGNGDRLMLAHRAAWVVTNGPIPKGMVVAHKCDQPLCCNPSHMFIGTQAENLRDMRRKGRQSRGETNGNNTLNNEQVYEIRRLVASGESQYSVALKFGVTQSCVSVIVSRKTWNHLSPFGPAEPNVNTGGVRCFATTTMRLAASRTSASAVNR